jgi:outer membrane receptor protein involved in Fe transport
MFKPTPDHSLRASYNRAFVSPSFINNYLDQNIQFPTVIDYTPLKPLLGPAAALVPPPFFPTVNAFGNPEMKEQSTDAYEVAYTGTFGGKTMVGLAAYLTETDDNINFTYLYPEGTPGYPRPTYYNVQNPARGVTVPTPTTPRQAITLSPTFMGILATLPAPACCIPYEAATYLNLGPIRNRGIEASVDHRFNSEWSLFANYSWQDEPEPQDADPEQIPYPVQEVGIPSEHRVNAGLGYNGKLFFANANVNYASEALWVDVLNQVWAGFTDSYTMLNATVGVKLADGKVMVSLKGMNLTNDKIQQHIFGDILKRSVVAELRFFSK